MSYNVEVYVKENHTIFKATNQHNTRVFKVDNKYRLDQKILQQAMENNWFVKPLGSGKNFSSSFQISCA